MKEHPIIFSGPMIRAILEGRKRQTRRIAKFRPAEREAGLNMSASSLKLGHYNTGSPTSGWVLYSMRGSCWNQVTERLFCRYGTVGDRLWVREMFQTTSDSPAWVMYAADSEMRSPTGERKGCLYQGPWKPSIHMPRKFSRIALEIVDVRVQRLQEISEEDAIVEGSQMPLIDLPKRCQQATLSERTQFSRLWDSINAKRAPWASDPWVWVITFRGVNA